jgi:hypothetical protein
MDLLFAMSNRRDKLMVCQISGLAVGATAMPGDLFAALALFGLKDHLPSVTGTLVRCSNSQEFPSFRGPKLSTVHHISMTE